MISSSQNSNSIRFKLLRIIAYALILAISLSGLILLIIGNFSAQSSSERNLITIGEILAEKTAFELSLGQDYASEVETTLAAARHHQDISRVCLYNAQGEYFASYLAGANITSCPQEKANIKDIAARYNALATRIDHKINLEGDILGSLIIESKGVALKNSLALMAIAIFGTLFFAVLLAFKFGSNLVQRSLIPLSNLSQTGKEIALNPFIHKRASKTDNDEVGELVDVFNSMLDALDLENQKLVSSENTFRTLSENAPVGVFLRGSPKNFDYTNTKWAEITGLTPENANRFSEHISSEYKRQYIEKLAKLGHSQQFVSVEFEFIKPDGELLYLQEYVSVINEQEHTYYIGTLLNVTELKNTQTELEKLAFYDPLTQLPNRRYFTDHLQFAFASAEKKDTKIAVFITDLDNFKRVNDSLGHDAGDKLLQKVGGRLRDAIFREDIIARMGGDEFIILVEGIENLNSVEFISKRLINAMHTEAEHELTNIPISGSIGVAIYPEDTRSPEELLRFADMALYNSKAAGGNTFSCYSADLDHAIREHIHIEQKLRTALDNHEIDVYLQPQYEAGSHHACWAEALVRWNDKDEGFISPVKFIPVAEETGLIHELGDWIIERVCQILAEHSNALQKMGIQGISINLSAKQFFSTQLESTIGQMFRRYGISPSMIEFELTESTVIDDVDRAIAVMERLRDVGCRLSMDDFGTGYSSLSYLKQFPITSLKIDRSFVMDIPNNNNDCEIACAIINLAHSLGMSVVAEGVETQEQADFLHEKGCEFLQGFFLAKPSSIQDLLKNASIIKPAQIQLERKISK